MLDVSFFGWTLEGPLMNAAGTCKTVDEVEKFAQSPISVILAGSFTHPSQLGNSGNTYYSDSIRSLNSKGIPNGGLAYVVEKVEEMVQIAHTARKLLAVSVSSSDPQQLGELVEAACAARADFVEVNLACPNLFSETGGKQKPVVCFYPSLIRPLVKVARERRSSEVILGWKISVFSNPIQLIETVDVIGPEQDEYMCMTNTFPNGYMPNEKGKPALGPVYGGMGGRALKPIALAHVRQVREHYPDANLVGVGGIFTGQDLRDILEVGANAAQAATVYFEEGLNGYSRIMHEYTDILVKDA